MEVLINFGMQRESSSAKRQACYTARRQGDELLITGRSPNKDDIGVGTVFKNIPYNNFKEYEFIVKEIEHRPHKGPSSHLWHWTAKCKAI